MADERRMSTRTRQPSAALARLEALENDNAGTETVEANDDEEASLDDDSVEANLESLSPPVPSYLKAAVSALFVVLLPACMCQLWNVLLFHPLPEYT